MLLVVFTLFAVLAAASDDAFDYGATDGNSYGTAGWDQVQCDIVTTCVRSC